MFNNVVLDVFVGLILIYLLYSLLATIVGEMLATWLNLRPRILRVSIEKMLNDGDTPGPQPKRQRLWFIVQYFFLKEFKDFRYSFAGKFYDLPSIKYITKRTDERKSVFTQTKPSYISADNFAESLIQLLKDKGTGRTEMDKVNFCLKFNTHHIQPVTLKHLRDIAAISADVNFFKEKIKSWYNETQDRATGSYKRKTQLILFWLGFFIAAIFNVDSIRIAKILSRDKEARRQLTEMSISIAKDSSRYSHFVSKDNDSPISQPILDSGLSRINQDINEANLVLGLGWGTSELKKQDFICINRSDNNLVFERIAKTIRVYKNLNDSIIPSRTEKLIGDIDSIDRLHEKIKEFEMQYLLVSSRDDSDRISKRTDSLVKIMNISVFQKTKDSLLLQQARKSIDKIVQLPNSLAGEILSINSMDYKKGDSSKIEIGGSRGYYWYEKGLYITGKILSFRSFWGFFITGLMISLGAPFWFDLLKKLVAVRVAGVKPDEKKQKNQNDAVIEVIPGLSQPALPAGIRKTNEDVVEEAFNIYADQIKQIPGVRSVFVVFQQSKKAKQKIIQVNVDNSITKKEVVNKFPQLKVGNVVVRVDVKESGVPVSHQGHTGTISNKSGNNGFGTLGCVLERTDTASRHILSCWHVLKGDTNYSDTDSSDIIVDNRNQDFANRWGGGIDNAYDYGIAICFSEINRNFNQTLRTKLNIPGPIEFRNVERKDIENQVDVKYYDCLTNTVRQGFIYSESDAINVDYPDKTRVVNDVLILTDDNEQTISKGGNSGSIIFDQNNKAIAMIISGDLHYSYAIKLSHIFKIHDEMKIA